ncbi:MAG TPA: TonB-dependent receptor plug domain-containing protein [Caulobacteraceae bacterium]|jgi:Fe(3+) dicitrate transport protein|nr:TonB-dependent receptor plug domain-containing protein [Caulobacteraceae bacterium]
MSQRVAIGVGLSLALFAVAAQAQSKPAAPSKVTRVSGVDVKGHREDTRAKLDHIMREVDGPKITVGKRSSMAPLDLQPPAVDEAPRELFARLPGVLETDPQTPLTLDFTYRGFGGPNALGYVAVLQDGLPITADRLGEPLVDYLPMAQDIGQVQMIRGGSSLIYGPAPAAAINLVSRRPKPGEPMTASSEQIVGSNGLYDTWNTLEGTSGVLEYRADLGYATTDGDRDNARSNVLEGDGYLGWRPNAATLWYLDLHAYRADAGDPGRLGYPQYLANAHQTLTPFNHDWVSRYAATLGNELDLGDGWHVESKLWASYTDLYDRTAANGAAPLTTTLQDRIFRSDGLDLRLRKSWGRGNAFTAGVDLAEDHAPWRQWTSGDVTADLGDRNGATPRLNQARRSDYAAVFAENVFRLPGRIHVVPSVRLEHEGVEVDESVAPPFVSRPLIHADAGRDAALFGFGIGNDFGKGNESYFSISQGYRPIGFLDIASPFTGAQPRSLDPSRSLALEAGVHGTPVTGLFYDAGVYQIDLKRRVETVMVDANPDDLADIVTGDVRSRGFEGEISYDFLAVRESKQHLVAYAALNLNDSRFTSSDIPGQAGKTPAYAPRTIAKAGVTWREDQRFSVGVAAVSTSAAYFQDSDLSAGSGASFVPAKIPARTVIDLSGEVYVTARVKLIGGVRNLGGEKYYARAFTNGVEPSPGRTVWAGVALGF